MTDTRTPPTEPGAELLRAGRFFRPGTAAPDLHSIGLARGREADAFYRDRWSHDKVVNSTHGVNCTGSCRWKVHVKDSVITWETQQTDCPSVGPDRPEYEPRGCPRGAVFSWYTYSPTRVRYLLVAAATLGGVLDVRPGVDGILYTVFRLPVHLQQYASVVRARPSVWRPRRSRRCTGCRRSPGTRTGT